MREKESVCVYVLEGVVMKKWGLSHYRLPQPNLSSPKTYIPPIVVIIPLLWAIIIMGLSFHGGYNEKDPIIPGVGDGEKTDYHYI